MNDFASSEAMTIIDNGNKPNNVGVGSRARDGC
jgi:hypothetical protein